MGPPAAVAGGGCWGLWGLTRMRATGALPQGSEAEGGGSSASDEGSVPMVVGGTFGSDHFPSPLSALTLCVHWWSSLENCWRACAFSARSSMSASISERALS